MTTAREIQKRVRAQLEETMRARTDAAVKVATLVEEADAAEQAAAEARQRAGVAVEEATTADDAGLSIADLQTLTGVPAKTLRALQRATAKTPPAGPAVDGDTSPVE